MRGSWISVVGAIAGVVGTVVWSVCLAIYQPIMEPTGFFVWEGTRYPEPAESYTYWPRELRQLGILLALAGLLAIGRAATRSFIAVGALGVSWLAADLWLDRIDVEGRSTAVWLAVAGCLGLAGGAAAVSRGGPPSLPGRYLAAGTAAVLATAPTFVLTPWYEPLNADQVAIENAMTTMCITMAVGFIAVVVAMLAPATTARSRWLLLIAAAVTLAVTIPNVTATNGWNGPAVMAMMALATVLPATAEDPPPSRLLVVAGVSFPVAAVGFSVGLFGGDRVGRAVTALAGNPPVHGADEDLAVALCMAMIGLALAATSRALIRRRVPAPEPAHV